jgi:hypothetical protein
MNRSLVILLGALALGAVIFGGAYRASQRACQLCGGQTADDLAWLQTEFHLSEVEMANVRKLHAGYEPQCMAMCALVAAKKTELAAALAGATNVTAEAQNRLSELHALRAQCQTQMLQHFFEVSRTMPPEQGRRYLAEMEKLTLGFNEPMEQTMSMPAAHEPRQP